jgi:hypothetical protein
MRGYQVGMGLLCLILGSACQPAAPEQALSTIDKKSAREVTLRTVTQGDSVFHITVQNIWFNGEQIASHSDTLITSLRPQTWEQTDSAEHLGKVPIYVTVQ